MSNPESPSQSQQEFTSEQIDLITSLEPNFDPQLLVDAGIYLPIFVYGTLMPGAYAGSIFDSLQDGDAVAATLPNTDLYSRRRFTGVFGNERG